jgi:hypothetical protein
MDLKGHHHKIFFQAFFMSHFSRFKDLHLSPVSNWPSMLTTPASCILPPLWTNWSHNTSSSPFEITILVNPNQSTTGKSVQTKKMKKLTGDADTGGATRFATSKKNDLVLMTVMG